MAEFYVRVFLESFWYSTLIPFSYHATYFALKAFHAADMTIPTVLVILGCCAGHATNFWVGRLIVRGKESYGLNINEAWYQRLKTIFEKYLVYILLFTWAPMTQVFVVAAGAFRIRFSIVMTLVAIGHTAYYLYQVSH